MQTNGQTRIIKPGSVDISMQQIDAPGATPAVVPIGGPDGQLKVLAFGGLSKVEHLAGLVAAPMVGALPTDGIAKRAVAIAREIIAEAAKPQG